MTTVVAAGPVHVDAIAALVEELHTSYGETDVEPRDVRIRQTNEALFGDPPLACCARRGRAGARRAGDYSSCGQPPA
ncbi:hypothetical protein [Micromonospora sp. KC207]|uniref:hypothetical protein n=1 Tax=Micromonospora sp. KC207 TaxID=2530377 RepID=UPI001FB7B40E|nr:hypothetical protein [Micromonospora sp. KC207]